MAEKKKKAYWGWGIAIFYSCFVVAILSFLFYSRTVNVDLVDENYYEKDLAYQGTIDRMENANALIGNVTLKQNGESIVVAFPDDISPTDISGAMRVLRPSEKDFDMLLPVELDGEGKMNIDKSKMPKGKWVVQIEWETPDMPYYYEQSLMVY
jgi:hypothetical protein